jgi:hypothetical protein
LPIFNTILGRLGHGLAEGINVGVAKDNSLKTSEEIALQRLGKKSANICDVGQ